MHMTTSEHNNSGTITISVRTSRETKEQLENLAESMGRSTNYVVGEALTSYISENAWQVEAIGKAVAEADAGGPSVSQEATERWLKSWGSDHELPKPEPDTFN